MEPPKVQAQPSPTLQHVTVVNQVPPPPQTVIVNAVQPPPAQTVIVNAIQFGTSPVISFSYLPNSKA